MFCNNQLGCGARMRWHSYQTIDAPLDFFFFRFILAKLNQMLIPNAAAYFKYFMWQFECNSALECDKTANNEFAGFCFVEMTEYLLFPWKILSKKKTCNFVWWRVQFWTNTPGPDQSCLWNRFWIEFAYWACFWFQSFRILARRVRIQLVPSRQSHSGRRSRICSAALFCLTPMSTVCTFRQLCLCWQLVYRSFRCSPSRLLHDHYRGRW